MKNNFNYKRGDTISLRWERKLKDDYVEQRPYMKALMVPEGVKAFIVDIGYEFEETFRLFFGFKEPGKKKFDFWGGFVGGDITECRMVLTEKRIPQLSYCDAEMKEYGRNE